MNPQIVLLQFNKKQDGPDLEMFESPMFTSHMVMKYLHKRNRVNIIEYLINKLYRQKRNDYLFLDFYLPQLCYLSITKQDPRCRVPIQRFVLQMSIKYPIFGLKALLWYLSWMEDEKMPYQ